MKYRFTEKQRSYMKWKRTLDLILSFGACLVLSPALLLLCIAIKMDSRGPVLFKQKRVGIHKTYFPIYKFRTMRIDTPKDMPTHLLANPDQYITKVGHFLRKSSLDELPQLVNVLRGEMSLVGPRPPLPREVAQYGRYEWQRLSVVPGLTCYWQVRPDRYELSMNQWVALDLMYIQDRCLRLDWQLIFQTAETMVRGSGR